MDWLPSPSNAKWLVGGVCFGCGLGLVAGILIAGIKPATHENSFEKSRSAAQSLGWEQLDQVHKASQAYSLSRNPGLYKGILSAIADRLAILEKSDGEIAKKPEPTTKEQAKIEMPVTASISQPAPVNGSIYLDGSGKLDINAATLEQIDSVSRMSTDTAKDILNYIKTKGPVKSFDEFDSIPNVGPKTIEKLRSVFHIKR
jgi:DNA uptake protein ComE-like DNA-binding protein